MPRYEWNEDHQAVELIPGTFNYRSKWACFTCQKSFTRIRSVTETEDVICPDCKMKSTDMGHLFEPPPKKDNKSWRVMEILGRNNIGFCSVGNVVFIKHYIMDYGKCSPQEVHRNIAQYLGPRIDKI